MFQIRKKYMEVFRIREEAGAELSAITKGYAFAFQALGNVYWEARNKKNMEGILSKLDDMLDDFIYRKVWRSLSEKDRAIVLAMGETETKVRDICAAVNMTPGSFSQYRDKLIRQGIITSPGHGYVSLTLPRFSLIAKSY